MSLTNRNETRLLVENWRKVLETGLYQNDPEVLEEGFRDKLMIGALLAANIVGGINVASAKAPSDAAPAQTVGSLVAGIEASGVDVRKDDIWVLNVKNITKSVNNCYIENSKRIKGEIDKDEDLKQWFNTFAVVNKMSEAQLIDNYSREISGLLCNSYYEKIVESLPEVLTGRLPNAEVRKAYTIVLLVAQTNFSPSDTEYQNALDIVTGSVSNEGIVAKITEIGTKSGAQKLFSRFKELKPNLFHKTIRNYFQRLAGNEEELLEKIDPSVLDRLLSMF
jgi:hypothetical protein